MTQGHQNTINDKIAPNRNKCLQRRHFVKTCLLFTLVSTAKNMTLNVEFGNRLQKFPKLQHMY